MASRWVGQLPFPPSVNSYWRTATINGQKRTMLSAKGRSYRNDAIAACVDSGAFSTISGRVRVCLTFCRKDRRAYDLDNFAKAVLDALQHAGVIEDDGQIDHLVLVRGEVGLDCVEVIIDEQG
jgi:crossover junction endodeoxyribonuclease RusA